MANAAEISRSLFAHVADEDDASVMLWIRALECARHCEDDREAATVVRNARPLHPSILQANADIGAFGKHRVEMAGENDRWAATTRPPQPLGDDVADRIHACA